MAGEGRKRRSMLTGSHPLAFVFGATILLLVGVIAGLALLLSGTLSTAATKQHFRLTYRILEAGLHYSVRSKADDIDVPSLTEAGMVERGLSCYRAHCAQCHDSPAAARHPEGMGLMPIPSNLAQAARDWPPSWLYYVTKEGVRMTGMPAWGLRLSDEALWSTVAFLKTLPRLTEPAYLALERDASTQVCPRNETSPPDASGEHATIMLAQYGCHSCHVIEGLVGPSSHVGPPLVDWSHRKYIAGVLPNTEENLVRWILDPKGVSPQTLMPDLDVAEAHAREMAAYLSSLN